MLDGNFFRANGIPCELSPVERGPAADATLLKTFRVYLDDIQVFLKTQPDVDQGKIVNIAIVAKRLKDAITNQTNPKLSNSKLN